VAKLEKSLVEYLNMKPLSSQTLFALLAEVGNGKLSRTASKFDIEALFPKDSTIIARTEILYTYGISRMHVTYSQNGVSVVNL
jgi:hypothetical protein